jgi:hypothetical protein
VSVDRGFTEPERLRELCLDGEHRGALGLVRERIENAFELLAVDAIDDGIELVADALARRGGEVLSTQPLTVKDAARIMRDAVKDKSYRAFPLGQAAGHFLRSRRKRLTPDS